MIEFKSFSGKGAFISIVLFIWIRYYPGRSTVAWPHPCNEPVINPRKAYADPKIN
jgi:hypothetical protein